MQMEYGYEKINWISYTNNLWIDKLWHVIIQSLSSCNTF